MFLWGPEANWCSLSLLPSPLPTPIPLSDRHTQENKFAHVAITILLKNLPWLLRTRAPSPQPERQPPTS